MPNSLTPKQGVLSMMKFDEVHLGKIREMLEKNPRIEEALGAAAGHDWVNSLGLSSNKKPKNIDKITKKMKRDDIFELNANQDIETIDVCAAIFAWGGMRRPHGKKLFEQQDNWIRTVDKVRRTPMKRCEAYASLHELRKNNYLPGMGPAFFTKLIFFLRGELQENIGYIMDQWTACSINLLVTSEPTVLVNAGYVWKSDKKLNVDFQVSEHNDKERYEKFCCWLDKLAKELELSPINAELLLMSSGRGRGEWRNYVVQNRLCPR
jgi:hypothetical protein